MSDRYGITRYRLPSIQLRTVSRDDLTRARHVPVRHNPGANPMRAIGIAALQQHLRTFLPLSREKLHESAACMRHHMRPPLRAHQAILYGPLPIPNHGSASVSPAHPRRTMAAHVHPNPLPAYQANGSRLHPSPARPSPRVSQGLG